MTDDLMNYARGDTTPSRQDRPLAAKARGVYEDVRLGALMADGALALSATSSARSSSWTRSAAPTPGASHPT